MPATNKNDDVLFDFNSLRLIIGALAFAFPAMVVVLSGKITTSISASYYEPQTRDVFVGFLFIIGALLISYQGHTQGAPKRKSESLWHWILSFKWLKTYQEDVISTIGGAAAIFTALYPTACDGCPMDTRAVIHMVGAFILFATVVYFCMIAFLRSLNQKLLRHAGLKKDSGFKETIKTIRENKSRADVNLLVQFWNYLSREMQIFLTTARAELKEFDLEKETESTLQSLQAYQEEMARGWRYVVCGSLITVTLLVFVVLLVSMPDVVSHSTITFIVETIALVLFGIAWMTASKFKFFPQIISWFKAKKA